MTFTDQQINDWLAYERVKSSGRYNMITQVGKAARAARLSYERYFHALTNYSALKESAVKKRIQRKGSKQ